MSYEGYTQYLCKNGHYFTRDCYEMEPDKCPFCDAEIVWWNMVNTTNGSFDTDPKTGKEVRIDGYVELEILEERKCDKCNSVLELRFKVPEKGGHKGSPTPLDAFEDE